VNERMNGTTIKLSNWRSEWTVQLSETVELVLMNS